MPQAISIAALFVFAACTEEPGAGIPADASIPDAPACQQLAPSNAAAERSFGRKVIVDATWAIVSAAGSGYGIGAVHVFEQSSSGWVERQILSPTVPNLEAAFGTELAASGDTLFVGTGKYGADPGSVEVFIRGGAGYARTAMLHASDATPADQFGKTLVVRDDLAIVGAWTAEAGVPRAGATYVFARDKSGWLQTQKLEAPESTEWGKFGASLALDGTTLLVGEPGASALHSGAVHVFDQSGTTFAHRMTLVPAKPSSYSGFGSHVALRNGTAVVSGALQDVHVFEASGSSFILSQTLLLYAPVEDVALGDDNLLIGTPFGTFISHRVAGTWSEPAHIHSFGRNLALNGARAILGNQGAHRDGAFSGAVDVLNLDECNMLAGSEGCSCPDPGQAICHSPVPLPMPIGSECPAGYWLDLGTACEPSGECGPAGTNECQKTCISNADCNDPCLPVCRQACIFDGGHHCFDTGPLICRAG